MRVTVLNQKEIKDKSFINSTILLILGIFLTFNSEGLLNIIFDILGGLIIAFGIYHFVSYYRLKSQLNVENSDSLTSGIFSITIGLIIILLSNFLTNAIQIVTGIWLFFMGMNKLSSAIMWKNTDKNYFTIQFISSIILVFLGIYTIFTDNVVFIFIGIILIIYSIADLINYFMKHR